MIQLIGGLVYGAVTLFVSAVLGTLVGGLVGFCVDLAFPFVTTTLNQLAGTGLTAFEMGAVLGFIAGFFSSSK